MASRTNTWVEHNIPAAGGASTDCTYGVHEECYYSSQDVSTDGPTAITSVPTILMGIYISTVLSAHVVAVTDGASTVLNLPASMAAGTFLKFPGIRFATDLRVAPNASSTGVVVFLYRPL